MEDYETIEHDMIHIKDYFRNYKFGIQERLSKLYFLNNLNTDKINDTTNLLKQSKDKLVEIKNKGKECEQFIFSISTKFYNIKNDIEIEKRNLEEMTSLLKNKEIEYADLNRKGDLYGKYEVLNGRYKNVCGEIKSVLSKIGELKKELEIKKEYNLEELEIYKNKLQSRTRRLSVIQYEKYVEDLYDFYKKMMQKIGELFKIEISTKSEDSKIFIFVVREDKNEIKIEIVNGQVENIKGMGDEKKEKFYKKLNDPRLIIYDFVFRR